MNGATEAVLSIVSLIVGVAIIATLVSPKANTAGVIQASASGLGNDLGVALSPVTGNSYGIDLSYGNGSGAPALSSSPQLY